MIDKVKPLTEVVDYCCILLTGVLSRLQIVHDNVNQLRSKSTLYLSFSESWTWISLRRHIVIALCLCSCYLRLHSMLIKLVTKITIVAIKLDVIPALRPQCWYSTLSDSAQMVSTILLISTVYNTRCIDWSRTTIRIPDPRIRQFQKTKKSPSSRLLQFLDIHHPSQVVFLKSRSKRQKRSL